MTSEAAALTEQEIRAIEIDGLGDTDVHTAPLELVAVIESILAARLADSRPNDLQAEVNLWIEREQETHARYLRVSDEVTGLYEGVRAVMASAADSDLREPVGGHPVVTVDWLTGRLSDVLSNPDRLADSRPVVSEAAVEAAGKALEEIGSIAPNWTPTAVAQIALTAALPHMSDGKGEAEHERVLQGVKDCWKVDMRENRLLRDGIEKLADELEQQHRDAFGESLADNFPSALVTDLRDLLNPPRLSPTGDDT